MGAPARWVTLEDRGLPGADQGSPLKGLQQSDRDCSSECHLQREKTFAIIFIFPKLSKLLKPASGPSSLLFLVCVNLKPNRYGLVTLSPLGFQVPEELPGCATLSAGRNPSC